MTINEIELVDHVNPDPLLTMRQAANYLGISLSKMYELARESSITVVKVTADARVRQSVLEEFIRSRETIWKWSWSAPLGLLGEKK